MKNVLFFLLIICSIAHGQKTFTPSGSRLVVYPATISSSTTETNIFTDTILANNFNLGRDYQITAYCAVTTPAVNLSTLSIKIYIGSTSITLLSGLNLAINLTTAIPFTINWDISSKTSSTQQFNANFIQTPLTTGNLSIPISSSVMAQLVSESTTIDVPIRMTVQFGGVGGSSATFITYKIIRDF